MGTGYGGEEGQTPPVPSPAPMPMPTSPVPVPNPSSPSVTCEPIGNCGAYSWCNQAAYVEWCSSQNTCPAPYCKTASSAPPSPPLAPVPMPTPTTTTIMTIPNSGRRCVPTLEEFCTDPMCRWEESLAQESVRRHRFLGLALLQGDAD